MAQHSSTYIDLAEQNLDPPLTGREEQSVYIRRGQALATVALGRVS